MKKLLFVLLMITPLLSVAGQPVCEQTKINTSVEEQVAKSGCCSHHGGVCGCSGGNDLCCDGAPSPTCGCHANDDLELYLKTHEAEQPKS